MIPRGIRSNCGKPRDQTWTDRNAWSEIDPIGGRVRLECSAGSDDAGPGRMRSEAKTREYAAFLRGITNVPMRPFRDALVALGFTHVASFGTSGNLVFCAPETDEGSLERLIGDALGVEAFVRGRDELAAIVDRDPYAGREGSAVLLAKHLIDENREASLLAPGFDGTAPVVSGSNVYFVHPTRRPGRRGIVDFERELGVRGTMRSSRVLPRILKLMSEEHAM